MLSLSAEPKALLSAFFLVDLPLTFIGRAVLCRLVTANDATPLAASRRIRTRLCSWVPLKGRFRMVLPRTMWCIRWCLAVLMSFSMINSLRYTQYIGSKRVADSARAGVALGTRSSSPLQRPLSLHRLAAFTTSSSTTAGWKAPFHSLFQKREEQLVTLKGQRLTLKRSAATTTVEEAEIVEEEDFMDVVASAVKAAGPKLIEGLNEKGYAIVDEFLPSIYIDTLRKEAVNFYEGGSFEVSQSSRFDPKTESLVTYDKHNVYAMQLNGGEDYYKGPRLHEYVVSTVKSLVPILRESFPAAMLDSSLVSNKLAVCTGEGSAYDKHYDNAGYQDTRKVTVLLYFNKWRPELGG